MDEHLCTECRCDEAPVPKCRQCGTNEASADLYPLYHSTMKEGISILGIPVLLAGTNLDCGCPSAMMVRSLWAVRSAEPGVICRPGSPLLWLRDECICVGWYTKRPMRISLLRRHCGFHCRCVLRWLAENMLLHCFTPRWGSFTGSVCCVGRRRMYLCCTVRDCTITGDASICRVAPSQCLAECCDRG